MVQLGCNFRFGTPLRLRVSGLPVGLVTRDEQGKTGYSMASLAARAKHVGTFFLLCFSSALFNKGAKAIVI